MDIPGGVFRKQVKEWWKCAAICRYCRFTDVINDRCTKTYDECQIHYISMLLQGKLRERDCQSCQMQCYYLGGNMKPYIKSNKEDTMEAKVLGQYKDGKEYYIVMTWQGGEIGWVPVLKKTGVIKKFNSKENAEKWVRKNINEEYMIVKGK